jgi:hypothetical protein
VISTGSDSTVSREVEIIGYVLDEPSLRRMDEYARASLSNDSAGDSPIELDCVASTKNSITLHFKSVKMLLDHFSRTKDLIKELGLDYQVSNAGRINIFFHDDVRIRFIAYGPTPNSEFIAEGLTRELKNCDPHYNWLARLLAFSWAPQWWLTFLIVPLSFFLLAEGFYYVYASRIGVNVDSSLLYEGNTYYQDVERAITSSSIEDKLDVLLKGHLKGFTNVSAVLENTQVLIGTAAIALFGMVLLLVALRSYSSAYARAFFALGLGTEQLRRLERKRDIWVIAVAIAFVVNLVAGLLVAFVS